jgi:hypothetical protein
MIAPRAGKPSGIPPPDFPTAGSDTVKGSGALTHINDRSATTQSSGGALTRIIDLSPAVTWNTVIALHRVLGCRPLLP